MWNVHFNRNNNEWSSIMKENEEKTIKKFDGRLLLVTTLLISICSIIYELIISSISSYLQGDSITQFSITIGLYKKIKKNLM